MASSLPIDVIVPAYNAAPYLSESLGSIARQTRLPREIFVIDDGSTDDTAAVARAFGVNVISVANRGVAEARNVGIRASSAPVIALLDADDRWHPNRLEAQWRLHEAAPDVLMIASDYALWDGVHVADGSLVQHPVFPVLPRSALAPDGFRITRADLLRAIVRRNFVLPSSMLLDRRLFEEYDAYFASRSSFPETDEVFIGEDFEWLLRVLRFTDVAFVDRVLVDYRIISSSLSARRGRIRNGDVALGELVGAEPQRYAIGAPALFAEMRPQMLREAAVAHLRAGEVVLGAKRLTESASALPPKRAIPIRVAAKILGFSPLLPLMKWLVKLRKPAWLRAR